SEVIETVQYQWEDLCRRIKSQIDTATKKDLVKPREGVRLLEFYEGQMLAKTYLNIDRTASTTDAPKLVAKPEKAARAAKPAAPRKRKA
ncbi:MAG: hypothetical protein EAZ36_07315, partial [Verrucomicrobia bacterium]